ncbi:phospholipase [Microbacterium enclense]|uniref:aggregation-promoting factor C-terminal-like domain-containing protein n=1 Tax=Microbacterium enclense TaxID=993073 RepID=UPI0036DEB3B6
MLLLLRSDVKLHHVHRARRTLATAATCAGVALGMMATTGVAVAAPVSMSDVAGSAFAAPSASPSPTPTVGAVAPAGTSTLGTAPLITSPTLRAITSGAADAQSGVDTALADAAAVQADIAAAGLPLSVGADTTVDTSDLQDAADRLSTSTLLPVLMLPALTQNAEVETERVADRVEELRGSLDAALAQKAAEEAAAAAAAEAQRQAEAAAAAEAQREAEAAAALARVNTPDGARAVAAQMAAERYGWGSEQFSCLSSLWQKESGWNYQAYNPSGATGIPQSLPGSKMASAGSDWQTNAATQIAWGLDYIDRAYGTPCSAWSHSQAVNWY